MHDGQEERQATILRARLELLGDHFRIFVSLESAGGLVLLAAAVLGMLVSNSPLAAAYGSLLMLEGEVRVGALSVEKPFFLWVNDLWMAVFFFLVSMEIKEEVIEGYLSSRKELLLPAIAAAGGITVPAAIFVALNWGDANALSGWAIPTATDIAFALGVLTLLGSAVPVALKALLMAVAVLDDLAAITIIAAFYSGNLSMTSLVLALIGITGLVVMNRLGIVRIAAYVLVGTLLWVCVLKSGVHATLAGVALGFAIPARAPNSNASAPLRRLIEALHPWVAFGILPAFAFVNAGIDLTAPDFESTLGSVPVGIALGLFIGKPLGVFAFTWLGIKLRLAALPPGTTWGQVFGVAALCGIGFTMSLFIGSLAYAEGGAGYGGVDRLGIIVGSLASGIAGYSILRATTRSRHHDVETP